MFAVSRRRLLSVFCATLLTVGAVSSQGHAAIPLPLESPTVTALVNNDMDTFRRMMMAGTNPNTIDVEKRPLLIIAVRQENVTAVNLLLDVGARVDERDALGNSALSWAASLGADHLVERLLAARSDVNQSNQNGQTPLIRAAQGGWGRVVTLLIKAGADAAITDYTGRTALDWARDSRSRGAERALLDAGISR